MHFLNPNTINIKSKTANTKNLHVADGQELFYMKKTPDQLLRMLHKGDSQEAKTIFSITNATFSKQFFSYQNPGDLEVPRVRKIF